MSRVVTKFPFKCRCGALVFWLKEWNSRKLVNVAEENYKGYHYYDTEDFHVCPTLVAESQNQTGERTA